MSTMSGLTADEEDVYRSLLHSDMFIDQIIADQYKCPICLSVLLEPHQLATCEHLFCGQCIKSYFQTQPVPTQCPMCRHRASAGDIRPAHRSIQNILDQLETRCRNYTEGCTARMTLNQLTGHESQCRYSPCRTPRAGHSRDEQPLPVIAGGQPMVIQVKLAAGSRTVTIYANTSDTVATLKNRIWTKVDAGNGHDIRLFFNGKWLDSDQKLLTSYGIRSGGVVYQNAKFPGGHNLY